ncbi:MAG: DNA repair protein RecO [Planctomycetaceae bacterium]
MEKAEAIVIRLADFSESSRVVTLFSKEFGKISALAKGAKRLKGSFDAALDLLSQCRIVFIRKSSASLDLLTEARLAKRFRPASGSLTSLYGGYYVADLLCKLTEDYDPSPELFDLAVRTLDDLADEQLDSATTLVQFEVSLLQCIGVLANLFECSICGKPIDVQDNVAFWVSQGGVICGTCRRPEFSGKSISGSSIAILRQMTSDESVSTDRPALTKQQTGECHRFAVSAITGILGKQPGTLRYLDF